MVFPPDSFFSAYLMYLNPVVLSERHHALAEPAHSLEKPFGAEFLQLLDHSLRLGEAFEELVDLLHGRAASLGDPQAATAVDDAVIGPLARRHRADDGFDALD